jgi:hypothetical protein
LYSFFIFSFLHIFPFFFPYFHIFDYFFVHVKFHIMKTYSCLIKHHVMKTYWDGGTAPHILNLYTRWRSVVSFTPLLLLPPEKRPPPPDPSDRRLRGPQNRF